MGRISITNKPAASGNNDPEKVSQAGSDGIPLNIAVAPADKNESLTLEQYRALVGIPQEVPSTTLRNQPSYNGFVKTKHGLISFSNLSQHNLQNRPPPIRPATITHDGFATYGSRFLTATHILPRPAAMRGRSRFWRRDVNPMEAAEYATSFYYTILRLESDQNHLARIYNVVTYICLVAQLAIASVLIILGAILKDTSGADHRIAIAVLGAVTGLLTGIMSLVKGQGYPTRMVRYADRLREVRDKLEFMERALRANCGAIVTFEDVLDIWNEFEKVREEHSMNRPDFWTTWNQLEQPVEQGLKSKLSIMQRKNTGGLPTHVTAPPRSTAPTTHGMAASTASHQHVPSQQQQQHVPATPTHPPPTRGNTIRISNDGRNKETNPAQ